MKQDIDADFQKTLRDQGNADQYFFPRELSHWKESRQGERLTFRNGPRKTQIGGIRLQAHDPSGRQPALEQQCQYDLSKTVGALIALRKKETFRKLIISEDAMRASQEAGHGRRLKLGLANMRDDRYGDDVIAARICHRRIIAAIRKAGFLPISPEPYDPATGMKGLQKWAETVKFRRRLPRWPLLLLLLPFLLWIPTCKLSFFGTELKTHSFILIIDNSPSMGQTIEVAKDELKRFLAELNGKRGIFRRYYVDVISFNDTAASALGGLKPLNDEVARKLDDYLTGLQLDPGTRLQSAIEMAAGEVVAHDKPTTLFVVTDAQDDSIPQMLQNIDATRGWFKPVKVYLNATTPNVIFNQNQSPLSAQEQALRDLSEKFEGEFGHTGDTP